MNGQKRVIERERAIIHTDIQSVRISTAKLFLGVLVFATVHRMMLEIDRRTPEAYSNHFKD